MKITDLSFTFFDSKGLLTHTREAETQYYTLERIQFQTVAIPVLVLQTLFKKKLSMIFVSQNDTFCKVTV